MKRALALLAALAMVLGALWWKGVIGGGTGDGTATGGDAPIRLLCATELTAACAELDTLDEVDLVRTEDPGVTADALAVGTSAGWDAWLVSEPWPAIAGVRADAADRELTVPSTGPLATASLEVIATRAASDGLGCAPADAACALSGSLRTGIAPGSLTDGALGAAATAAAVIGDPAFATNDLGDFPVRERLDQIANGAQQVSQPAQRLVVATGSFDLALGLAIPTPARSDGYVIGDLAPAVRARAVVAVRSGDPETTVERIGTDRLRSAFSTARWEPVTGTAPPSGLPKPAVVDAVARMWDEVRR